MLLRSILQPYLVLCLAYRMLDTLRPRNPSIGIDPKMRLRNLIMIHNGPPYPKMHHIISYNLLSRFVRPHVIPKILHGLFLIARTDANGRPRLCNRGGAH